MYQQFNFIPMHEVKPVGGGVYIGVSESGNWEIVNYCRTASSELVRWRNDIDLAELDELPYAVARIRNEEFDFDAAVALQKSFLGE